MLQIQKIFPDNLKYKQLKVDYLYPSEFLAKAPFSKLVSRK